MAGPTGSRSADKLNIIGVVTVGICGAVLTYVSVILLEAFYMNETSQISRQRAFESPQSLRSTVKALHLTNLDGQKEGTISIDQAMKIVVAEAAKDASNLVPAVGPSRKPSVKAEYGRPGPVEPGAAPAAPAAPGATDQPGATPAAPGATPPADAAAPAPAPTEAAGKAPAPAQGGNAK